MRVLLASWFAVFVALWLVFTWSWPFVGDASLIRYVVLSLSHHLAPYRDVHDINLPGTYLLDWLTLHLFGAGASGLRCYDSLLLAMAAIAMVVVTARRSKTAGFCAACLLALFHGRDGAEEIGQRDLAIAVLLLLGMATLVVLSRRWQPALAVLFGMLVGFACLVKPIALSILLVSIPLVRSLPSSRRRQFFLRMLMGFALPLAGMLIFLQSEQGMHAGVEVLLVDIPFHARLGTQSIGLLLRHLFTPSLAILLSAVGLGYWLCPERELEDRMAMWGIVSGALCYLLQLRGLTYHRYPFVACVLLALALTVPRRMRQDRNVMFACSILLVVYCAVLCPLYLKAALKREQAIPVELRSLEQDLNQRHTDGGYQCIDTIEGCINALVNLHLQQATGTMYDEFLFHAGLPLILQRRREAFLAQLLSKPPSELIIMAGLFPETAVGYAKLEGWPAFQRWLKTCYLLDIERTFPASRPDEVTGYKIYRLSSKACPQLRPMEHSLSSMH